MNLIYLLLFSIHFRETFESLSRPLSNQDITEEEQYLREVS